MKLTNFFIRILFLLGISKKLQHSIVKYQASYIEIEDTWLKYLPWYKNKPEYENKDTTNYDQYSIKYGVFTVRAKLDAGLNHIPAVWMLYIDTGRSYEEIDFELIESPSWGRKCLYISSYINHVNSKCRDEDGTLNEHLKKWQVRICNQALIDKLRYSYNNFTFEIRPGVVRWYINDRMIAKQRIHLCRALYFVLSNVLVSSAVIQE